MLCFRVVLVNRIKQLRPSLVSHLYILLIHTFKLQSSIPSLLLLEINKKTFALRVMIRAHMYKYFRNGNEKNCIACCAQFCDRQEMQIWKEKADVLL